jgi:hypothetical protein
VYTHAVGRAEPPKPVVLEFLLGNSEAIRFLGSATSARLVNNLPLLAAIDYFLVAIPYDRLHRIDVIASSTCTTTSIEGSLLLTWLIQLLTVQLLPPSMVPLLGTPSNLSGYLCRSCFIVC